MKHWLPERAGAAIHSVGEKLSMFALAGIVLAAAVGSAFAAGWVIGRMLM
jgi:hypothetical protein